MAGPDAPPLTAVDAVREVLRQHQAAMPRDELAERIVGALQLTEFLPRTRMCRVCNSSPGRCGCRLGGTWTYLTVD